MKLTGADVHTVFSGTEAAPAIFRDVEGSCFVVLAWLPFQFDLKAVNKSLPPVLGDRFTQRVLVTGTSGTIQICFTSLFKM